MTTSRRLPALLAAATLLASNFALVLGALPAEAAPPVPAPNPDLNKACGLNVLVILDESGSIGTSNATGDVQDAFRAFIGSLNNTGSKVAVEEFSTVARLPQIGGSPAGAYVTIDDSTVPDFNSYITNQYRPGDRTNWEDAMRLGFYGAPRPDHTIPHLVVFITDGDPTAVIDRRDVTDAEYFSNTQLTNSDTSSAGGNAGLYPAIPMANAIKGEGSHILAIGVGAALTNNASRQRLISMSGPDVYSGTGTFDIATDDVYLEPDFANLETALRETAFQLCAPSVNIRKLVDFTPDPNSLDDAVAGTGFEIEGTVTDPAPTAFSWVLPNGAVDGNATASAVTDGSGFAAFQWTPADVTATSDFEAREVMDIPGAHPSTASCTYRTPDTPDTDLPFTVITESGEPVGLALDDIPSQAIVTCLVVNVADPDPSVDIEKYTNGVDADSAPGPIIPLGDTVSWTYVVTNTGNMRLDDVAVTDDVEGAVSCPTTTLAQGEFMTCSASGTSSAGQYANEAEVTAIDSTGTPVSDSDPSHYSGTDPSVSIEKATVAYGVEYDADAFVDTNGDEIAPLIAVGDPVSWVYRVTNTGNEDLDNVVVSDDQGVTVVGPTGDDGDGLLNPLETWEYTGGPDTAADGPYANLATVTAEAPVGGPVTDSDPSHYRGYTLGIDVEKTTNGQDADLPNDPDVPVLRVGDQVFWSYQVTNTGTHRLTNVVVTDDQGATVDCSAVPDPLLPGATGLCHATGTALDTGSTTPYANVGTVVAEPALAPSVTLPPGHPLIGATVNDQDPSHYVGLSSGITIEKSTNGQDADTPTGPFVPVGDAVTWTYLVANTGTSAVTDIIALDYRAGGGLTQLTCPQTTLAGGEAMVCTIAPGVSIAGQFVNFSAVVGLDEFGDEVWDSDPSHYFGADPDVQIEKYTNGIDADDPMGAFVAVGDPVEWTYVVTNTGNDTLNNIVVTDDQEGSVTCAATTLAPGASTDCTLDAGTSVAVAGQYSNEATVTATDSSAATVTDTDPSHYFGYEVDVDIEKATNGEDADSPTGPTVAVGSDVTWTYVVTNPGDVPLLNVAVTDDQGVAPVLQGGDTNGDNKLDPGEAWTYEATGTATLGQYQNNATVTGLSDYELDIEVSDTDPSHYLGVEAAIQIDKTPDEAEVPRGNPHTFQIEVTNIGTQDLTAVEVSDPVTPACDRLIGDLAVGEVVTYECDVAEVLERIDNIAYVEGTDRFGGIVTDEDGARVLPVQVGGTALLGDTVWRDDNGNGVQDGGEPGIAGARVHIVGVSPLTVDETQVTDADGHYFFAALVAGSYQVTLDLSSVSGTLTTPGSFSVPLAVGEQYLDADFGVQIDDLPFTGSPNSTIPMALLAAAMLCAGAGFVLIVRSGPGVWRHLRG